jgi:hypothetical protein
LRTLAIAREDAEVTEKKREFAVADFSLVVGRFRITQRLATSGWWQIRFAL